MNLKYSQRSIIFWWDNPWNTSWESHFLKSLFYLREQSRSSCNEDQRIKYITEKQDLESESEKLYKSHKNVIQVKAIFSKLEPKSNQIPASVNKQNTRASPVSSQSQQHIEHFQLSLCFEQKHYFKQHNPTLWQQKRQIDTGDYNNRLSPRDLVLKFHSFRQQKFTSSRLSGSRLQPSDVKN